MESSDNKVKPFYSPSTKAKCLMGLVIGLSLFIGVICVANVLYLKYEWINVHLVPHSHDDVGWLKTPEEYYDNYVKYILDHVILELHRNSRRKFVFVETYFFWKWWQEQSENTREVVRYLIKNKQFELIGGGWCMSDEAVTHYQSFIDQSTWGLRRLNDTFGRATCPTVAWQIDTFGHSKGIASLLAQMGFTSLFFARLDFTERQYRKKNKLMEFVWTGNRNLGDPSSIFTSIFYDHYSSPKGFDFEMQAIQEDIFYGAFSNYVRNHAKAYRTDHIFVPMGDDFRYFNAKKYFYKMDMLIRFFQENSDFKLNVFYSTPTSYIRTLQNSDLRWPEKSGDFFPYLSELHGYWTGYFTSRPTLKYFERISNNFLQVSKQLLVLAQNGKKYFDELTSLREAVGVLQHHDAITGTAQQHVTDHYGKLLYEGIESCEYPVNLALGKLSVPDESLEKPLYMSCLNLNVSSCPITETCPRFLVTVYNSLSRRVNHYVRIPVTGKNYGVFTAEGKELEVQMVPIPLLIRNIPGRRSFATSELVFKVTDIPALGFKSFYVAKQGTESSDSKPAVKKDVRLFFDFNTNMLSEVRTGTTNLSLCQRINYYKASHHWSGAYLFRPVGDTTYFPGEQVTTHLLSKGNLVEEYEQVFSSWASQIVRIYKDENFIEFEWLVGPIPVNDYIGREVVLIYSSNIKSGNNFYTDVNGMEMEKRVRDYRHWREKVTEKVSGNYYPVTTMISIKDDSNQMYVIVDRPQGGASLRSGEIELMVHRRLCYDDGKGVDEPLNETAYGTGLVARGRHWLLFGRKQLELEQEAKMFSQTRHSEPWLFFSNASSLSFERWRQNYVTEFSGLNTYVPRNVRILTLEPWREDTVLLRLEHIFEKLPSSRLANAPVKVSLKDLFKNFDVVEARETALGADRWLSDVKRLKWRTSSNTYRPNKVLKESIIERDMEMIINLKPQQIRTFIVKLKSKN